VWSDWRSHGFYARSRWWYSFAIALASFLAISADSSAALCIQGWSPGDYNRDSDNAIASSYPLTGIRHVASCNSDRKIPVSSYESRNLVGPSVPRIDHRTLCLWHAVTPDGVNGDKRPKLPAGLLSVIGGNIATAIAFAVSQERYASKKAQRQHERSALQTSQSLIESLLLGLAATILLLILEVSIRSWLVSGF
jgi:hypothetical protein